MSNLQFFKHYEEIMSDEQNKQLYDYYLLIAEYNKKMNLTGIDEYKDVYLKHFYDSLTLTKTIDELAPKTIADLGTGAGLPGIVLAIYYPDIKFHLIEPLTKRVNFLKVVVEKLNLKNVILINERSEDVKEQFDIVVSRAVAHLQILSELAFGITKVNGYFIALKGPKVNEELDSSANMLKVLKWSIVKKDKIVLPIEESTRYNIIMKKTIENKKYPRNFSQIKKKPL